MRGLLYIILILVLAGCGLSTSRPRELTEAQRLMHSDPAAAWSKLNALDISEFRDSATIAHWALLYSEAMVINKVAAPTDTIVNIAIDYYASHHKTPELQKASRLKALIQSSDDRDSLATALYLQKEKEFLLYKERSKRETFTLIGILIMLIAAGVIIYMRQRIKVHRLENETLMAEASGLQNRINADRKDIDRLQKSLHGLLDNRFTLIDSLCQTYYETQGTKAERKAIIDKVKDEIESVRSDSFPKMERVVNDCRDNILGRIKESYPDMKADDYQLLVYLASGLSTRTISLLMDKPVDVIYKRKSRLKYNLKSRTESFFDNISSFF